MEDPQGEESPCKDIPSLLSSFVETFVDFSVSGFFLLPEHNPRPHSNALRTRFPSSDRVIAIGDLHGDLEKTRQSLRLAGLVDGSDRWGGGSTMVVQIGDVLDRGNQELKILYFIEKLKREAARCGGTIISMNGNHEIMNVDGDFRFVTEKGMEEFKDWANWYCIGNQMKDRCEGLEKPKDPFAGIPRAFKNVKEEFFELFRARIAALRPSGPISARFLLQNVTVVVVGESVFVHGGLSLEHVSYGLEVINKEVRDWINGLNGKRPPSSVAPNKNTVVWLRKFSHEEAKDCDCSTLEHVLATIPGVKRMIMGHTIQRFGINGACKDRAIRIDVGMSKGCIDGFPEVLEINGNSPPRILTANPAYYRTPAKAETREGLGLLLPEQEQGPKQVQLKA